MLPLQWELVTGSFTLTCMSGLPGLPEACTVMNPKEWLFHSLTFSVAFFEQEPSLESEEPLCLTYR